MQLSSKKMLNRRAAAETVRMSLFPFLAVLLCTMGALLVLLVVFARQAQLQASNRELLEEEADVEEPQMIDAAEVEKIHVAIEDSQWRMEQIAAARKATEEKMLDARDELSHLEDHTRRLQEKLEMLRNQMKALESPDSLGNEQDKEILRRRISDLQVTLAREMQELDKKRGQIIKKQKAYAVVPHTWKSGTHREPIYLECTSEGIRIQPSGVLLTEEDVDGPGGPQNPLAASLRAVREYMAKQALGAQSNDRVGEPYPLMLVRKGGIEYFYVAQKAMRWDGLFGYELIEDGAEIVYPEQDPKLTQLILATVDNSRKYQQRLRLLAQQRGAPITTGRDYLVTSRGLVPRRTSSSGMSDDSEIQRRRSTSDLPTDLRHLDQNASGVGGIGALAGEGPGINFDRNGSGGGGGIVGGMPTDGRGPSGAVGFGVGGPYARQNAGGANQYTPNSGALTGGGGMNPAAGGTEISSANNYTQNGMNGLSTGGGSNPLLSGGPGSSNHHGTGSGNYSGMTNSQGSFAGTNGANGGATGGPGGSQSAGNSAVGMPGSAGGDSSLHGSMSSAGSSMSANTGTPSANPMGGTSVGAVAGGMSDSDDTGSRLDRAAPITNGAGGEGEALRPGQWEDAVASSGGSQSSCNSGSCPTTPPKSQPKARKVWTTDRVPMGAVPFVRTIRVRCNSERMLVSPEPGVDSGRVVYFLSDPGKAVDSLIDIVVERMELWGMAGEGMYWRPVLEVTVEPDGQQRFEQVNYLLDGSGLRVEMSEASRASGTLR